MSEMWYTGDATFLTFTSILVSVNLISSRYDVIIFGSCAFQASLSWGHVPWLYSLSIWVVSLHNGAWHCWHVLYFIMCSSKHALLKVYIDWNYIINMKGMWCCSVPLSWWHVPAGPPVPSSLILQFCQSSEIAWWWDQIFI